MIKAITPIRFPSMAQDAVSDEPLIVGELLLTDTGRLIIGPSDEDGNIAFDREHFPFTNIEVLTETSPRTREVIAQHARSQNRRSYFIPAAVKENSGWTDVRLANYDGGYSYPLEIEGPAASVQIDFHVFIDDKPVRSGLIRALCKDDTVETWQTPAVSPQVEFRIVARNGDFIVQVNNHSNKIATLLLRKVVVSTARKPDARAPIWTTPNGSVGSFPAAGAIVSIQLLATDPNGSLIIYSVATGELPPGLSLSSDGLISGTITTHGNYVFTVRAANAAFYTDREFSITITAPNAAPVWSTNPNLGTVNEGAVSIQLAATDPEGHAVNYLLVSGTLPTGLLLSSTGMITGNTSEAGAFTFTIKALDGVNGTDRQFTLTVIENAPPVWTTPAGSLGNFTNGQSVNITLTATDPEGGNVVYNVDDGLPLTFIFDGLTGGVAKITGSAPFVASPTTYTFTVNAIDPLGNQNPRVFTISVHP